jgi:hypothetical protein
MVREYRKNPVVIEALEYTGTPESIADAQEFVGGMFYMQDGEAYIRTLEGDMHASVGDFIIKGVNGEFYPCKPDIFWRTYQGV